MKIVLLCAGLFLIQNGYAQQREESRPESNHDLRGLQPLMVIENLDDHETVKIEKSGTGDFFVVHEEGKEVTKNKLGRSAAESLDGRFSAAFLKVQYELKEDPQGCDADWRLVLRGEEYRFCPKNEQKDQEIRPIFSELLKASNP